MDLAIREALGSTARKGMVGAFAAKNNFPILGSRNGTLPGEDNHCELPSGITRADTLHAEENMVTLSSKLGISLEGATIYLTRRPCEECWKLLASMGIVRLIYLKDKGPQSSQDDHLFKLLARGVDIHRINPLFTPSPTGMFEESNMKLFLYDQLLEEEKKRLEELP